MGDDQRFRFRNLIVMNEEFQRGFACSFLRLGAGRTRCGRVRHQCQQERRRNHSEESVPQTVIEQCVPFLLLADVPNKDHNGTYFRILGERLRK